MSPGSGRTVPSLTNLLQHVLYCTTLLYIPTAERLNSRHDTSAAEDKLLGSIRWPHYMEQVGE